MKSIGLYLGLTFLWGAAYGAPKSFSHSCGTGCAVNATLVGMPRLGPGEIMQARFRQTILTNGKVSSSSLRFFWASCSNYSIAFNDTNVFPESGWKKLNTIDFSANYTTSSGGFGYYFDALCPDRNKP